VVATTLLGFWFKNYYPSYFTQKGKNLADKEDISELTIKIESVKKEFTKDLESFKTKLSYDREYKLKQKIEERDAIYKFWESICSWNFSLTVFNGNFKTTKEDLTYRGYMKDLRENLSSSISSLSILQLKVDDESDGYNVDVDPSAGHIDPSIKAFFSPTDDLTILLLFS